MKKFSGVTLGLALCILLLGIKPVHAQAPIRVDSGYEDSVRIVLLWNNPAGSCGWMPAVGQQTRDSILKAISGGHLGDSLWRRTAPNITPNIKVMPTLTTTWADIQALWPGKLPHVIVHSNAGWGDAGYNGDPNTGNLANIYTQATRNYVGVVEIGDDASWMAINVFGLTLTDNIPPPIGDGTQYTLSTDTMFVGMYPQRDTLLDSTRFPHLNGIVRNASNLINNSLANPAYRNTLFFKPYVQNGGPDTIRCQADADRYNVQPGFQNRLLYLGYQDASRNGVRQVVAPNYTELDVIVAFQDTIRTGASYAVRRAVALSMEPQFLKNRNVAVHQLVYDAIMFASLAWQLKPVNNISLQVADSCIRAGDTTTIKAILYREAVVDTSAIKDSVTWRLDPATTKPGDWISGSVSANKGQKVKVSGTMAYRTIDVIAQYKDPQNNQVVSDTAHICVLPATSYRVVIVGASDTVRTVSNQNTPRPLDRVAMDSTTNHDTVFAVTYDRFNNWVGKADNASWNSLNQAVVKANAVLNKNFAGNIDRMTKNPDSAYVVASQTGLISDSVRVVMQTSTIVAIRIVDSAGVKVDSVLMYYDEKKLLQIQVKWLNDTATWVNGTGSWVLNPAGAIQWVINPPSGNQTGAWTLTPRTAGKVNLTVTAVNKSITIPITVRLRPVDKITLQVADSSIRAGDTTSVKATLFRKNVPDTSSVKDSVVWRLDPATAKPGDWIYGNIAANKGQTVKVSGTVAYRYIDIIAQYTEPQTNVTVIDTAHIYVVPTVSYRIVIVGASDTLMNNSNKNTPFPLPSVTLDSGLNKDTVYAVTYDKYNNWTGRADNALWTSLKPSAVSAEGVQYKNFAGALTRITRDFDSAYVVATQSGLLPDSIMVILQPGFIIDVRLVDDKGNPVSSVTITTDQTKALQIQVKWSNDTAKWVNGSGSWKLNPDTIQWVRNPPAGTQTGNWVLDPKTPGQTDLTVSSGRKSITVPVTIIRAEPSKVVLTVLTPADSLIAGKTIQVEVRVLNTDGLVPGLWCTSQPGAGYQDAFNNGARPQWVPSVTITSDLTRKSMTLGSTNTECFFTGVDTIGVVLYIAPFNRDTAHQLSVVLATKDSTIKGSTVPFILLPGPLDSISIEDAYYTAIPGPLTLRYPGDQTFLYSNGYDHYQNLIGHINSAWTQTNTLHPIAPPTENIFRIFYEAVDKNEEGFIITQATSAFRSGVKLYDSVQVSIKGSQATIDSAVTKDLNGNGYLDRIYVYFNKPVALTLLGNSAYKPSNISVRYSITTFTVDSIRVADTLNKTFIVYLHDAQSADNGVITAGAPPPQTAWRPVLTMNNLPENVKVVNYTCKDGAGPVIWRVVVNRNDANDRAKDIVTVTFSEPIKAGKTGDEFTINTATPSSVFTVWSKTSGAFVKLDTMLSNISNFSSVADSGISVSFFMKNKNELFSHYYFNIISSGTVSAISDKAVAGRANVPVEDNQKVRVEILGALGNFIVGPNPLKPTITVGPVNAPIDFNHTPQAADWARKIGGAVFRISISPGDNPQNTKMSGYLRIYDVVGNLVNYGSNDDILKKFIISASADTSAVYNYDIYWNGTNREGMMVAPGAYLGVLYMTIAKNGISSQSRQSQPVGVARWR